MKRKPKIPMLNLQIMFCHHTMVGSREQAVYPGPSRFDPISGGIYLRPDKDCFQLKKNGVKIVQPGMQDFKYEIGGNDTRSGLCKAMLIRSDEKVVKLNQQQDCISRFQAMRVDIPEMDCTGCVLRLVVEASANEIFDSCMDVTILKSQASLPQPSQTSMPSSNTKGWICDADGHSYTANGLHMKLDPGSKCINKTDGSFSFQFS